MSILRLKRGKNGARDIRATAGTGNPDRDDPRLLPANRGISKKFAAPAAI
jgi:hypothetical protein